VKLSRAANLENCWRRVGVVCHVKLYGTALAMDESAAGLAADHSFQEVRHLRLALAQTERVESKRDRQSYPL
jgi:hypothetical protein